MIWESWSSNYDGHWKQRPEISGGGFMFDTGAHMMNTVCLLANSDFDSVSAYMNNHGEKDRYRNRRLRASQEWRAGDADGGWRRPSGCASYITFFYSKAIVRIDAWGGWREISVGRASGAREEAEILGNPMKSFLAIRAGTMENTGSVEMGLRFARLWDAIKESAAADGVPVRIAAP